MSDQTTAEAAATSPTAGRSLWRNRDFLLLWGGQTVSTTGSQVSQIAFPLLILAVTQSAALAGIAGGIRLIPYILLSLPAGALVDRWNRKRVMIICDTGRALALAAIPLALVLGRLSIALIFFVTLVDGTLYVFFNLAEMASIPHVVEKERLGGALALNEAGVDVAYVAGPAIGGALFGIARMLPFLGDAISYAVSVVSLLGIRSEFQKDRAGAPRSLFSAIREGTGWLIRHRLIRFLAILTAAANMVEFSVMLMIVVIATHAHLGSSTTGLILAIAGISGLIATPLVPLLQRRMSFGKLVIAVQWLYALTVPWYLLSTSPVALSLVTAVFFGIGTILALMQYTYRLTVIPDEFQGRVNSAYRLVALAGEGVGPVLAGILLQLSGAPAVIISASAILIILAIATMRNPAIREASSPVASAKA